MLHCLLRDGKKLAICNVWALACEKQPMVCFVGVLCNEVDHTPVFHLRDNKTLWYTKKRPPWNTPAVTYSQSYTL